MEPQDTSSHPHDPAHRASPSPHDVHASPAESKSSAPTDNGGPQRITAEMTDILKSAQERLREYGSELRAEIESDPQMYVVLERSASDRAGCRAGTNAYSNLLESDAEIELYTIIVFVSRVQKVGLIGRRRSISITHPVSQR